jgi:hypothetical protein
MRSEMGTMGLEKPKPGPRANAEPMQQSRTQRFVHDADPELPDVERAFDLVCKSSVRSGPEASDRRDRVRLDDRGFAGGKIAVYLKARIVVLWNPKPDKVTGEPVTTRVPFEDVVHWEPLTEAQAFHYYATAEEHEARRATLERQRLAVEAARAEAEARVLREQAEVA